MPHIVDDDEEVLLPEDYEDVAVEDAPSPAKPEASASEAPAKAEKSDESKPGTGDDDEDVESYSKRVQKRINKLTAKTRQLEQETSYWKERVSALEAKTSEREYSEFQNQLAHSETQLQSQYETAKTAYRKAVEDGDLDAQLKYHESMLDLRDQITEKKRLAVAAKEQVEKFKESQAVESPQTGKQSVTDNLPEGTKVWIKNNPWFMAGEDQKAANYARQLDADLQEEGYTPDDPDMYAELDRRLRVLVPRLAKQMKATAEVQKGQGLSKTAPASRVAGSSVDGARTGAGPTGKATRTLTHNDLTTMKRYNMDPNNAAHRKAWLHRNDPL